MFKIYLSGLIILVSAILLNVISGKLGITGWYDFLTGLVENGKKVFQDLSLLDLAWLFVLYPFLLGITTLFAERILRLIHL